MRLGHHAFQIRKPMCIHNWDASLCVPWQHGRTTVVGTVVIFVFATFVIKIIVLQKRTTGKYMLKTKTKKKKGCVCNSQMRVRCDGNLPYRVLSSEFEWISHYYEGGVGI